MHRPVIAFIGAGNMAGSLIGGLLADGYPTKKIIASNPNIDRVNFLSRSFGVHTTNNNREAAAKAEVIIFCVKPAMLKSVVEELKDVLEQQQPLLISIVTGIRSSAISKWGMNPDLKIIRCMPNTPALLRSGTTGLWANHKVSEHEREIGESILRAVGATFWFPHEEDLDSVTAISGSGPAYFFLLMECMLEVAKEMGMTDEQAQLLTVNTALGAARMALESGKDVKTLRQQVTSKGGTTEQAIKTFEENGLREIVKKALYAAKAKAEELAKALEN